MTKDEWIKEVLDILYMIDTTAVNSSDYQQLAKKLYDIGRSGTFDDGEKK